MFAAIELDDCVQHLQTKGEQNKYLAMLLCLQTEHLHLRHRRRK